MKKITFLVSLILIAGLSALDTESKPVDTKQNNVVVESNTVEKLPSKNSCAASLPNGSYTEYNPNGTLKSYQVITNADENCKYDIKKGSHTEYYEDGRLKSFQVVL